MKKLFLYILILASALTLSYDISYYASKKYYENHQSDNICVSVNETESETVIENNSGRNIKHKKYEYKAGVLNDFVVIYDSMGNTVEVTEVSFSKLDSENRKKIIMGLYFFDITEMYQFLESITS